MNISELIEILQEFQNLHGNLNVEIIQDGIDRPDNYHELDGEDIHVEFDGVDELLIIAKI